MVIAVPHFAPLGVSAHHLITWCSTNPDVCVEWVTPVPWVVLPLTAAPWASLALKPAALETGLLPDLVSLRSWR